ncbi:hypothetical protein GOBAR_AA10624 [Gossypium barbadense]|uniref:SWIM-type domain-containing protein n=1 Tax=Gossypium barbadense TaxID=3634 RepID=A0A2P5Y336_GOSBA|nr:hypothetical protein GOBAR_AA10624 [Gossypium barbadense]
MELVDDEDVETMIALYCGNGSDKNSPIHLFVELAGMEQNEDLTAYGEEHATEELCVVAPISYVDSESTIRGIDIDLNVTPDIDVVGDDGYNNSDLCDEEVDSDSDPDVDDVPDDIDDKDVTEDRNINASSVGNQKRRIMIHNNPGPYMSLIDPDAAHEAEFPEYPEILPAHRLAVNSEHEELLVGHRFKSKEECVFAIKRYNMNVSVDYKVVVSKPTLYIGECWKSAEGSHELEPHIFCQRMARLESDMEGQTNTSFQQWLGTMEPWQWAQSFDEGFRYGQMTTNLVEGQQVNQIEAGHVFVKDIKDAMVANHRMARLTNVEIYSRCHETFLVTETISRRSGIPPRSYGVDLCNKRCDCRRFQTLHYPCAHVVVACAKVNLNVEQFVDDVYTLERALRVWENEFPVLPDLSTWEVSPTTFELVPNRGLRKNPRGRPQSSRIRNEMDIREKSDGKRYGLCRLAGHNRSKCPQRNYHIG